MALIHYSFDPSHSSVAFVARHLMFSKVRGSFGKWSGTLALDLADLTKSKVNVEIDTASIASNDEKRDAHLRSADFFDAEKFPQMTFTSSSVAASGKQLKVTGDLPLHGVKKQIVLSEEEMKKAREMRKKGQ